MNMNIKTFSTTEAREKISDFVNIVSTSRRPIVIGRRNVPEVVLIPFPHTYNGKLSGIITIGDVVNEIIIRQKNKIDDLENYIFGGDYGVK